MIIMAEETKGQTSRKNIQQSLLNGLDKYSSNFYRKMANLIAFDFHLSPDTVKYRYLDMFLDNGILEYNEEGLVVLTARGKALQTTEDGLTKQELAEELQEENEQRNKLGKPPVSFEEWKEKRQKRIKVIGKGGS